MCHPTSISQIIVLKEMKMAAVKTLTRQQHHSMNSLPYEIVNNILSRLPLKSVVTCSCVCKEWRSIIADPIFHSKNSSILLFFRVIDTNLPGICYFEDNDDEDEDEDDFFEISYDHQFIPIPKLDDSPIFLGNCNGFITVFHFSSTKKSPLYIVNPITGERASLPRYESPKINFSPRRKCGFDLLFSGFVYQESKKVYKLVLVMFIASDPKRKNFRNEVHVCTLNSGGISWKMKSGIVPDALRKTREKASTAFVNESLHWVIVDESSLNEGPAFLSFNVDDEIFDYVPIPGPDLLKRQFEDYGLEVLEGKLAVMECFPENNVEIWIMNDYNVKESWEKLYSIKNHMWHECYVVKIIKFRKNGELLLHYDNDYVMCYNTKTGNCSQEIEWISHQGIQIEAVQAFVGRVTSLKVAFGLECDSFGKSVISEFVSKDRSFLSTWQDS